MHSLLLDFDICHLDHMSNWCPFFQHAIRNNVSCYYNICRSSTHDTEDYRLIDQIHDAIDIGV